MYMKNYEKIISTHSNKQNIKKFIKYGFNHMRNIWKNIFMWCFRNNFPSLSWERQETTGGAWRHGSMSCGDIEKAKNEVFLM